MKLTLYRTISGENGTFGMLCHGQNPICVTLEDPWKDNKVGKSCILAGTYTCKTHNGSKFKNVWVLENVKGRSAILIHAGNTQDDTTGCILVGTSIGVLNGKPAILNSQVALNRLRKYLPRTFELEIRNSMPQVFTKPKTKPTFWERFFS